jgi:hypothetical protein
MPEFYYNITLQKINKFYVLGCNGIGCFILDIVLFLVAEQESI